MFLTQDAELSFELLKSFDPFGEYHYRENLSSEMASIKFNILLLYNV